MSLLATIIAKNAPRILAGGRPVSVTRSILSLAWLSHNLRKEEFQNRSIVEDDETKSQGTSYFVTNHGLKKDKNTRK